MALGGEKISRRVIALLEFERFINEFHVTCKNGLAINGSQDPEWYYLKAEKITKSIMKKIRLNLIFIILDLSEKKY